MLSTFDYDLKRVKEKLKILNELNNRLPPANIIKVKGKYKVSFGSFPTKARIEEMKRYLDELYPNIQLSFKIDTVKKTYKFTNVFAGPFYSLKKAKIIKRNLFKTGSIKPGVITSRL